MPSFGIVSGDVIRFVTYCTIPGQVSTNSRDWQCTLLTGGSAFPSTAAVDGYDTMMGPFFQPLLSTDATYYGTMAYKRTPVGPAPRPDSSKAGQGPGQAGIGLLPPQTSGLISLYTDVLGKTGQGRMYVPFPSPLSNDPDGTNTGAYATALVMLADVFKVPFTVADGAMTATFRACLYQPGGAPPRFITQTISRGGWATQRRRGAYGAPNTISF